MRFNTKLLTQIKRVITCIISNGILPWKKRRSPWLCSSDECPPGLPAASMKDPPGTEGTSPARGRDQHPCAALQPKVEEVLDAEVEACPKEWQRTGGRVGLA